MININLQKRELKGKKTSRLRKQDIVPAVIYDKKGNSAMIQGNLGDFVSILRSATTTTIIEVDIDGEKHKAFIKDVETHPITDLIVHVSLFEVHDEDVVNYELPVSLIGVSPAIKNSLGVLVQPTKTLFVRSLLKDIQPVFEIDISNLVHPGQSINLSDITLPKGVEFVQKDVEDKAIVTITQLQKLVEETTEEVAPEGDEEIPATEEVEETKE